MEAFNQELYSLGPNVLKASLASLQLRYSLLKWYFSQFIEAGGAGVVYKPVFFEFPEDDALYSFDVVNTQVMIGSSIMVAPILKLGKIQERFVTFPKVFWFDLITGNAAFNPVYDSQIRKVSSKITENVPIFIRENSIVFMQEVQGIRRAKQLDNTYTLVAAVGFNSQREIHASGSIQSLANPLLQSEVQNCIDSKKCQVEARLEGRPNLNSEGQLIKLIFSGQNSKEIVPLKVKRVLIYGLEHSEDANPRHDGVSLGPNLQIGTKNAALIEFEEPVVADSSTSLEFICHELLCKRIKSENGETKPDL